MTENNFFAQITSQGKAAKRNWCDGKILYIWCLNIVPHPPAENINVALNLPKLL